eukprot:c38974_g1_i1.p1 GENE.c38974_g1_i1~~c38974_g1_i1.p1  ORF type:complete len:363 (+),score=60.56 c38974_g1_i1:37-1125(+)
MRARARVIPVPRSFGPRRAVAPPVELWQEPESRLDVAKSKLRAFARKAWELWNEPDGQLPGLPNPSWYVAPPSLTSRETLKQLPELWRLYLKTWSETPEEEKEKGDLDEYRKKAKQLQDEFLQALLVGSDIAMQGAEKAGVAAQPAFERLLQFRLQVFKDAAKEFAAGYRETVANNPQSHTETLLDRNAQGIRYLDELFLTGSLAVQKSIQSGVSLFNSAPSPQSMAQVRATESTVVPSDSFQQRASSWLRSTSKQISSIAGHVPYVNEITSRIASFVLPPVIRRTYRSRFLTPLKIRTGAPPRVFDRIRGAMRPTIPPNLESRNDPSTRVHWSNATELQIRLPRHKTERPPRRAGLQAQAL